MDLAKSMIKALGFGEDELKQLVIWGLKEFFKNINGEVKYKIEEENGEKVLYLLIKLKGVEEL